MTNCMMWIVVVVDVNFAPPCTSRLLTPATVHHRGLLGVRPAARPRPFARAQVFENGVKQYVEDAGPSLGVSCSAVKAGNLQTKWVFDNIEILE